MEVIQMTSKQNNSKQQNTVNKKKTPDDILIQVKKILNKN